VAIRHLLPRAVSARLFGDRARYGLVAQTDDPAWAEWQRIFPDFYFATQRRSIGKIVNDAGYEVMSRVALSGRTVLEVGPGQINHIGRWRSTPRLYVLADVQQSMLDLSSRTLAQRGITHQCALLRRSDGGVLPFNDETFDVVVSFYTLEHLYPLAPHIDDMLRVLKPGGIFAGAIPAEGGLGWGIGRYVTTRRWFLRNTSINPDKLICWEHPNFADHVLRTLDDRMDCRYARFWPLGIRSIDLNLVITFIYSKRHGHAPKDHGVA